MEISRFFSPWTRISKAIRASVALEKLLKGQHERARRKKRTSSFRLKLQVGPRLFRDISSINLPPFPVHLMSVWVWVCVCAHRNKHTYTRHTSDMPATISILRCGKTGFSWCQMVAATWLLLQVFCLQNLMCTILLISQLHQFIFCLLRKHV